MQQLGLNLTDEQVKEVTAQIKKLADVKTMSVEDVDSILNEHHARHNTDVPSPDN